MYVCVAKQLMDFTVRMNAQMHFNEGATCAGVKHTSAHHEIGNISAYIYIYTYIYIYIYIYLHAQAEPYKRTS